MTTSSSDDFTENRDEIIKDALANVGASGPNRTPNANQVAHAARVLNRIVKSIDADGSFLWRVSRADITTIAATASYQLGATIIGVDNEMNFRQASTTNRSLIKRITRAEYMAIPDRTQQSRAPTLFYSETDLSGGGIERLTIYFFPVPSASSDKIEYAAFTRGEDFDTSAHTSDFPTSWIQCLVWGLSAELAPVYGQVKSQQNFMQLFQAEKNRLLNADTEHGDVIIQPFGGMYGAGY